MGTIDPFPQCDQEDEGLFSLHSPLLDNYAPYLQSSSCAVGIDSFTKLAELAAPSCSSCPPRFTEGSDLLTFLELLEESESIGGNQIGSAQWDTLCGDDDDEELLRESMQPYIEDVQQHDSIFLPMQQQQQQLLDAVPAGSPGPSSNADRPTEDSRKTQEGRRPTSASAKPENRQAPRVSTTGKKRARKLLAAPAVSMSQRTHSVHHQRHSVTDEEINADHEGKPGKSSKNLDYERQRRQKLNATLYTLRALVPNISKMDKASIVSDAIDHVQSLRKQVKDVEDEILALKLWGHTLRKNIAKGVTTLSSSEEQVEQKILEVDVSVANESTYQLKILCLNGQGVIGNLTKALETLQFDIVNANVTTIDDHVRSTIFLEAKTGLGLKPTELRDMVLKVSLLFGLGISEN